MSGCARATLIVSPFLIFLLSRAERERRRERERAKDKGEEDSEGHKEKKTKKTRGDYTESVNKKNGISFFLLNLITAKLESSN